jgi:hypothetical protein
MLELALAGTLAVAVEAEKPRPATRSAAAAVPMVTLMDLRMVYFLCD